MLVANHRGVAAQAATHPNRRYFIPPPELWWERIVKSCRSKHVVLDTIYAVTNSGTIRLCCCKCGHTGDAKDDMKRIQCCQDRPGLKLSVIPRIQRAIGRRFEREQIYDFDPVLSPDFSEEEPFSE